MRARWRNPSPLRCWAAAFVAFVLALVMVTALLGTAANATEFQRYSYDRIPVGRGGEEILAGRATGSADAPPARTRCCGYDDPANLAHANPSEGTGSLAPQATVGDDDCDDDVVPLFKAPQPGFGQDQYDNGWNEHNLTADDDPSLGSFATFAKQRELAETFARSYGEGVIEVQIPRDIYDANFARYEYPYQGGPLTELEIPFAQLPLLNQFPRMWHR